MNLFNMIEVNNGDDYNTELEILRLESTRLGTPRIPRT